MKRTGSTLVMLALLVALAGCGGSSGPGLEAAASPATSPAPAEVQVPWADYAPAVRSTIDSLAAAKDCDGLQEQFDTADTTSDATRDRTGHGNAELMEYIDAAMKQAGCHN